MKDIETRIIENFCDTLGTIISELNSETFSHEVQHYLLEGFPKELKEVANFRSLLSEETDRGCALISASFIEEALANLLRSYLVHDKNMVNNILGNNGCLATFSAKIDISYLLGLIDKSVHRDLNLIRKIRNEFGHSSKAISFETGHIQSRCKELRHNYINIEVSSRDHFTRVVCGIIGSINASKVKCDHRKLKKEIEVTQELKDDYTEFTHQLINSVFDKVLNNDESK